MVRVHGTTCSVQVVPRDDREAATARFYFRATENRIDTTADIQFANNTLIITGLGFDGRCSFCRYFRLTLKRQDICISVDCPFETMGDGEAGQCKVAIGDRYFDQCYLENEENFHSSLTKVQENPVDAEAHLALGVIHEYHGRLVEAMSSYWKAFELQQENSFARARLREILGFLIELLPDD
jgi:hypothetical protein